MPIQQMLLGGGPGEVAGQQVWTANGGQNYYETTWTVPTGVSSISLVCVGKGAHATQYQGGAGGGLCYANNISVTAGETLVIYIMGGSLSYSDYYRNNLTQKVYLWGTRVFKGTPSSPDWAVIAQAANTIWPGGGSAVNVSTFQVRNGGSPGAYGTGGWGNVNKWSGGAGGAAGYNSDGGVGGTYANSGSNDGGDSSSGGGGGQGNVNNSFGTEVVGGGGGVGLAGHSTSPGGGGAKSTGSGGSFDERGCGKGGSGGTPSSVTQTAAAGGGGGNPYGAGCGDTVDQANTSLTMGVGAVRIIWPGNARLYPSTRMGNE
tara:strand:+ start:21 stop:971 length:951 start_codon:yes stop_codon:yes gene_type:complete